MALANRPVEKTHSGRSASRAQVNIFSIRPSWCRHTHHELTQSQIITDKEAVSQVFDCFDQTKERNKTRQKNTKTHQNLISSSLSANLTVVEILNFVCCVIFVTFSWKTAEVSRPGMMFWSRRHAAVLRLSSLLDMMYVSNSCKTHRSTWWDPNLLYLHSLFIVHDENREEMTHTSVLFVWLQRMNI